MRTHISKENSLQTDKDVFNTKIYGCFEERFTLPCEIALENYALISDMRHHLHAI